MDHPQYLAYPFYVAGDSYAGKIVPFVAQLISEGKIYWIWIPWVLIPNLSFMAVISTRNEH